MWMSEKAMQQITCCGPDNCGVSNGGTRWCEGRSCAGFRWKETKSFRQSAEATYRRNSIRIRPTPNDIIGYCGLAGPPTRDLEWGGEDQQ